MAGDSPTNMASAGKSELMAKVELLKSPDQKLRMTILVAKYLNATISKFEIVEMVEAGVLEKESVPRRSRHIGIGQCTQTEMAEILTDTFGKNNGLPFSKMKVGRILQKWKKAGYDWVSSILNSDQSVNINEFLAHYKKLETAEGNEGVESKEEADRRAAVHNANILAKKDSNLDRRFSSLWMTADAFEFFSGGFGATARNTALDLSERIQVASEGIISECVADLAQRQSLIEKLRPIYASKFEEWQIEFCQRLEDLLKQGKEMSEKQKLEMK